MAKVAAVAAFPLLPERVLATPANSSTAMGTNRDDLASPRDWTSYAGDKASTKYSSLNQIDGANFRDLQVDWTWRSIDAQIERSTGLTTWAWECTPLAVDGVLYVITSMSQVAAIDGATGRTLWTHDPGTWKNGKPSNNGFVQRGVTYWAQGKDRRILFGTGDGYLVCLHAATGKPVRTFGDAGRIDLTQGLGREVDRKLYGVSSPPIVCRDVIVIGSKVTDMPSVAVMPPGHVRGFDVRTGRQRWIFHSIPGAGEFGNDTWQDDTWKTTGAANVWTLMSADESLGYVYLPFGTTANDHYGVHRPGAGLFGDSLVCLDASSGKRVWHFQAAHHGLWDYDLPAAPNLIDVTVDGQPIRAVAQTSKQGFVYVFDRATGRPVWPIDERPVPASDVPGEAASPTQPFPSRPLPFDRQGVANDDVVDFTPDLRRRALETLKKYNTGPLFTPPTLAKPTINMPGIAGGASWSGAACDPLTGICYVTSVTFPYVVTLVPSKVPNTGHVARLTPMEDLDGVPLWKPPYGRLTAIDLNSGDHLWMSPVGDLADTVPALKRLGLSRLGRPARGHLLLTRTLVIVGQEGTTQREGGPEGVPDFKIVRPSLVAFDKVTGRQIAEIPLPRNATAAPMTCMVGGRQLLVVATGGANLPAELVAFRLPDGIAR